MLEPDSVRRIRARYDQIKPAEFCPVFFARLFEAMPDVRALMPENLAAHGEYVEAAIAVVIRNLADLEVLERPLEELGAAHARRGIPPERLAAAHPLLVETVRTLSGDRWTSIDEREWAAAFGALLASMVRGAENYLRQHARRASFD